VIEIDRGVPARRVDIVYRDLTKPGSYFDVLIWGVDSRFTADYYKGAWYVKTDYNSPNGRILKADPGIMPEGWDTVVPEGRTRSTFQHRRRKDLREAPEGREDGDHRLHAGRESPRGTSSSTASARPR
jgi:hypothetical protein